LPGDTPHEAVQAFLNPLREATAVLDARTDIVTVPGGGWRLGGTYAWVLNGADGADLGPAGIFHATMKFEVVRCDPAHEGVYRCSTRHYRYQLEDRSGVPFWRLDWHPTGIAARREPHLHERPDLKEHRTTPRAGFELAIRGCIAAGALLTCSPDEAEAHLTGIEWPYTLYRSWGTHPDEPRG